MTLLPVVERELRVAARGKSTYRARFLAAFIPVLFSVFSLWFVRVFYHANPISPRELFLALTWMEFAFVIIAGFSLTCDSISEEKRDATLGLLFLTDLKGYDVVLGKLTVAALRGIYAVIATLPVLALPLMMGGTNFVELARTAVTLLLTLLFSMGVGIAISAVLRRNWTAFGLSAAVLFVFVLLLPFISQVLRVLFRNPSLAHAVELPSPSYALYISFRNAVGLGGNAYFLSVAIIASMAFLAVFGAVLVTPHVWKDRPPSRRLAGLLELMRNWKYGARAARNEFRRRLLDWNPIYWLSRRERVSSLGMLVLILGGGTLAGGIASRDWSINAWQANAVVPLVAWALCGLATHVLMVLRIPVVAAERFGEDRKSGALELILSTPMTVKEVLAGHEMSLLRYFAGPAILALGIQALVILFFLNVQAVDTGTPDLGFWEILAGIWRHIFYAPIHPQQWEFHLGVLMGIISLPLLVLNWIALACMSTWLSIRVKNAFAAPIIAILMVNSPPWGFQIIVALTLDDLKLMPSHDFSEALVFCAIGFVTLLGFQLWCIHWCRRRLHADFRKAATDRYEGPARRRWWKWRIT